MSDEWEREKEKILGSLLGGGQELASLPSSIEVCETLSCATPGIVCSVSFSVCVGACLLSCGVGEQRPGPSGPKYHGRC